MTTLIVILLLLVLAAAGGAAALAIRSKRHYDAGNEVVPGVPTKAPAAWGGAHSPEAKLHRRLREVVLASRAAASAGLGDARATVEQTALQIDERLVAAAALIEPQRSATIAQLSRAVDALAASVAGLSAPSAGPSELDAAVTDVQLRLDALAQAREEVDRLDRTERGQAPPSTAT